MENTDDQPVIPIRLHAVVKVRLRRVQNAVELQNLSPPPVIRPENGAIRARQDTLHTTPRDDGSLPLKESPDSILLGCRVKNV